jgi:tetratricopeptide (TPR) repeat protein/TolB-like protein
LGTAHRVGVIHRDFKPGNVVLIPEGDASPVRVAITDFGLAFRSGAGANMATTQFAITQGILGTPAYMAPEQIEGRDVTAATDIYALGLVIHEMVTGALPFASEPLLSMVIRRMHQPVPSPRELIPSLDPLWDSAILRCLERDPRDRFQGVGEVVGALRGLPESKSPNRTYSNPHLQQGGTTGAQWTSRDARAGETLPFTRPSSARSIWAIAGISLALISGVGIGFRAYSQKGSNSTAPVSAAVGARSARLSAAVLTLQNVGSPEQVWLGTAIAEMLTTEMAAGDRMRLISGEDVARTETDLSLVNAQSYGAGTLQKIGTNLGCDFVVDGSFLASGGRPVDSVRVDLRLQDSRSGETLLSFADSGTISDIPDLVKRVGGTLREKLGIQGPTDEEASTAKAAMPGNAEAMRLYSDGLAKLRMQDAQDARADLQKAVSLEPLFALGHDALAGAWQFLGYDESARQEAKLAVDLSIGLSQLERRSIEGRYRKVTADWDKAIGIYSSLWGVYDDNPDYALELASVQTSAGKGHDALSTLLKLQARPDLKSDPRVDLAEAIAAESLADVKLQQTASARAAQEATQRGARLLAAQAYWQNCAALFALGQLKDAETACRQGSQTADYDSGQQVRARNLTILSEIMKSEGQDAQAMEFRKQALAIARQIGSRKDIIGALMNLANLLAQEGETAEALKNEQEAIAIAREIGDKQQLIGLEGNLASDLTTQGDYDQAKAFDEDALKTAREVGDKGGIATALQNLGALSLLTGDLSSAEKQITDGLSVSQAAQLQGITAGGWSNLGDLQTVKGQFDDARSSYEKAQSLFRQIGDRADVAATQLSLAKVALEVGDAGRAVDLGGQSMKEFQSEKLPDNEADARNTIARAQVEQGKLTDAFSNLDAAGKLPVEDRTIRASLATTKARLEGRGGNPAEGLKELDAQLSEAAKAKLPGVAFEIRLAQVEITALTDPISAVAAAVALERDARASAYVSVAQQAARLEGSLPASKPPSSPANSSHAKLQN